MEKNTLSASEAARVLGISRPTFSKYIDKMNFPVMRMGSKYVIPKEPLIEFLMRGGELTEQPAGAFEKSENPDTKANHEEGIPAEEPQINFEEMKKKRKVW